MSVVEPKTVGLSAEAHGKLKALQEEGYFNRLLDGYRFAIGLALARGVDPSEVQGAETIFSLASFDQDQSIKVAIEALLGDRVHGVSVYKMAERLAEWGVHELARLSEAGTIDIVGLLDEAAGADEVAE